MPERVNPYEAPADAGRQRPETTISFGEILQRGFRAAHRAPIGAAWLVALMAPVQVMGAMLNAVMFRGDFMTRMQSGQFQGQMPPEFLLMGGVGCLTCIWMPVALFAIPWIWGGSTGQVRDRLLGVTVQRFSSYGRQHYLAMLLLFLLLIGLLILIYVPNAVVSQLLMMKQGGLGQPMSSADLRTMTRHPINIASSIVTIVLVTVIATVINLSASAIAARSRGVGDGLRVGFSLCGNNLLDVVKLCLISVGLLVPFAALQWVPLLAGPPT